MEDDNEILDWGNEDDETQRKFPFDGYRRDIGDHDAEDCISLGDEDEDNQELEYRNESNNNCCFNMESQRRDSPRNKLY